MIPTCKLRSGFLNFLLIIIIIIEQCEGLAVRRLWDTVPTLPQVGVGVLCWVWHLWRQFCWFHFTPNTRPAHGLGFSICLYEFGFMSGAPCLGHYPPQNQIQNQTHPKGQETHQKLSQCRSGLEWVYTCQAHVQLFFLLLGTSQGGWALKRPD